MGKDKIKLPSSSSGLMQYYDEFKSKFEISPYAIIFLTIALMLVVVILHRVGPSIFGF